jgi:uncharacterized membrane protein
MVTYWGISIYKMKEINIMKRLFKFGLISDNSVCLGLFITSVLILFRFMYFKGSFVLSAESTSAEMFKFYTYIYYIGYVEPIIILIWLKLVCEFLFKLIKRH